MRSIQCVTQLVFSCRTTAAAAPAVRSMQHTSPPPRRPQAAPHAHPTCQRNQGGAQLWDQHPGEVEANLRVWCRNIAHPAQHAPDREGGGGRSREREREVPQGCRWGQAGTAGEGQAAQGQRWQAWQSAAVQQQQQRQQRMLLLCLSAPLPTRARLCTCRRRAAERLQQTGASRRRRLTPHAGAGSAWWRRPGWRLQAAGAGRVAAWGCGQGADKRGKSAGRGTMLAGAVRQTHRGACRQERSTTCPANLRRALPRRGLGQSPW